MSRRKKWLLYSICFLTALSIYHDVVPTEQSASSPNVHVQSVDTEQTEKIYVVERAIEPGDTLLSVIEEIHVHTETSLDMDNVIHDFKRVNQGTDPYDLQINKTYYFPIYTH